LGRIGLMSFHALGISDVWYWVCHRALGLHFD
jgi:hypothetical protein